LPNKQILRSDLYLVETMRFENPLTSTQPQTGPTAQDRRRSAREMRRLDAWLSNSTNGVMKQQQQVVVTSLSMHGVGFVAPKPLQIGESHWIVIANDRLHLSTRLRVVTVRPSSDGGCEVGGEFF